MLTQRERIGVAYHEWWGGAVAVAGAQCAARAAGAPEAVLLERWRRGREVRLRKSAACSTAPVCVVAIDSALLAAFCADRGKPALRRQARSTRAKCGSVLASISVGAMMRTGRLLHRLSAASARRWSADADVALQQTASGTAAKGRARPRRATLLSFGKPKGRAARSFW